MARHPRRHRMPWLARGFVAGAAGTAAMAAWYHLERLLRGDSVTGVDALTDGGSAAGLWAQTGLDYDDTVVPGRIVASILHLHNVTNRQAGMLTLGLRWGYGSAFGVAHVWLRKRMPEPAASLAFGGVLMTMTFTAFPVLGHTPPPWRWYPDVLASALGSHSAYVVTAASGGRCPALRAGGLARHGHCDTSARHAEASACLCDATVPKRGRV